MQRRFQWKNLIIVHATMKNIKSKKGVIPIREHKQDKDLLGALGV